MLRNLAERIRNSTSLDMFGFKDVSGGAERLGAGGDLKEALAKSIEFVPDSIDKSAELGQVL